MCDILFFFINPSVCMCVCVLCSESEGKTRSHARLCHLFGVKQMIVCVHKMDSHDVLFSQARFNEIKDEVSKVLAKIGFSSL